MQWQQQQQQQQKQMNPNFPQMSPNMANVAMNDKMGGRKPSVPLPAGGMPGSTDNMIQTQGNQFNGANATPDMLKAMPRNASGQTSAKVSPAKDRAGSAGNNSTAASKSASKKPSPGGGRNAKTLSNTPLPRPASANQRTVSPMANGDQFTMASPETNSIFKKEEDELRSLHLKKAEITSRFKHRQEAFQSSPLDLFLSTFADTLGLKDTEYEPQIKFSQDFIDLTNRTGKKKKITKVAQRARDRDPVDVSVENDNKLVMKSKFMAERNEERRYTISPTSIESVFGNLENSICDKLNEITFMDTPANLADSNNKKRKFEEFNLTPDSIKSNGNGSPSIMSDSKRIKFDSPEDAFLTSDSRKGTTTTGMSFAPITAELGPEENNQANVWDWEFWANKT